MPRREIPFQVNHFYHIYNRGNDRLEIFFEKENYLFFFRQLKKYLPAESVAIHSYCLMPNHFHLLVQILQPCEFSLMMKNFIISYTKAINKKYNMVGHLFQGQFKGKEIDSVDYLLTVSRYLHNNPKKAKLVDQNEEWEFSSYLEYLGLRHDEFIKKELILQYYKDVVEYKEFVESMPDVEFSELERSNFRSL